MSARRRSPSPAARCHAAMRGVGAGTRYELVLDERPVFDFVVSLVHDLDDVTELQPQDRRWLTEGRDALAADDVALLDLGHSASGPPNLSAIAIEHPEVRDAAGLVEHVRSADPADLLRITLGDLAAEHGLADQLEGALAGDASALAAWASALDDERTIEALRDPASWAQRLLAILEAWLQRYGEVEGRVRHYLERDLAARRGDLALLPTGEMVERTTGGIRFLADPIVRRVVLAPSYFARPFNYVFAADGWRLFCYPIADNAIGGIDPIAPPPAAVRLYRALGDETRLRILRLLSERDHYMTELAQQLELSKPTIKHHLAQLRAAGLVTLTEEGSLTYYSLRRDRIAEAGDDVMRYLAR
ncbi:MAG TPA: metalloregulator ArsR/SmtB family transcription factor [Candidatus Limnocylindrales bacterium]|nr:metalloregulator ArsR/SmtB family transcription factor [Candidatus Limnocylindrales bacterium]